ncbi:MAG: cbb3-type cytochrome c oxidase subunit 3 [Pseudomonadota bacterium]
MHEGLETYDALRRFADSWGLVFMTAVFFAAVWTALRARRESIRDQADIPFRNEDAPPSDAAAQGER